MITEYMDSKKNNILVKSLQKDKNIKNIFFTSALQINPTNKKVFNILKIIIYIFSRKYGDKG